MSFQVIINDPAINHSETTPPQPKNPLPPPPPPRPEIKSVKTSKTKMAIFFVVGIILGTLSLAGAGYWWLQANQIISPLGKAQQILGFRDILEKPNRIVFGYLPYWNFKFADKINYAQLTHLSLFGVAVTEEGEIQVYETNYIEPGYRNVTGQTAQDIKRQAQAHDVEVSLTITSFDNDIMDAVLADDQTRTKLIGNIAEFVKDQEFAGVNIDFEYVGTPPEGLKDQFSQFIIDLKHRLVLDDPNIHLSVAVYADSAINPRIWDLAQIGQAADHIIIMAYDFYRPASKTAGPVAPLFGAPQIWSHDIITLLSKHIELNPSTKIILGVPFYGYEWRTQDDSYLSPTIGRGATATHKRISQLIAEEPTVVRQWNNQALSPWITYSNKDNQIFQIYYDDIQSLSFKYDLTNQANLGGIAIWALGYEDDSNQMWQLIDEKF